VGGWQGEHEGRTNVGHAVAVAEDVLDEYLLDDAALRPGVVAAGVPRVAGAICETCRPHRSVLLRPPQVSYEMSSPCGTKTGGYT